MSSEIIEKKEKTRVIRLLKNWDFSALFFGGFINNIGSYFTIVAIVFLAIQFTKDLPPEQSTQEVALLTTFSLMPTLFLGPIGGTIVDRLDRKKILYFADFLGALAAISLFFSTKIWHLYIFSFFNASVRQFFYPAKQAAIPQIVEREQLLSANGFIQTSNQLARILGPLFAGFLTAAFGLKIAFVIDAISYSVSAILLATIKTDLRPPNNGERISFTQVFIDLKEGFRLTFTDKILRFLVIMFGVSILAMGMLDPLIVPYLNFEFGLNEKDFGLLMSFSAISGIIAAVLISVKKQMKKKIQFLSLTIIILATCTGFIAIAPFLPGKVYWLYVGFSLIGVINVGFNVPFSTLLQKIVRNEHLGKISGIIDTTFTASSLLAASLAAILAKHVSISTLFGMITIIIFVLGTCSLIFNAVKHLDTHANEREAILTAELNETKDNNLLTVIDTETETTMINPAID
ncbi:MAG: MFS transporter [Candidatus Heimdallarchaeaceae archaeon]